MKRVLLLLFLTSPSWAAISCNTTNAVSGEHNDTGFGQWTTSANGPNSNGTLNVSVGDLIFAGASTYGSNGCDTGGGTGSNPITITDSAGNSWTTDTSYYATGICSVQAHTIVTSASASDTISGNISLSAGQYAAISAIQCTGVLNGSIDQTASVGSTSANTLTTSSFTPGQANEVSIFFGTIIASGNTFTAGASPAYTLYANSLQNAGNAGSSQIEVLTNPATSSQTAAITFSGTAASSLLGGTFKQATSGGVTISNTLMGTNGAKVSITGGKVTVQ